MLSYGFPIQIPTLPDGKWHHHAMVFENGKVYLYEDGKKVNKTITWQARRRVKPNLLARLTIFLMPLADFIYHRLPWVRKQVKHANVR